jgi:hypothetical protein
MNAKILLSCLVAVMTAPLLLAHGDSSCGGGDDEFEFGPPTGATCPPEGTTLTFADFAEPFFESYCQRCHSSNVVGDDRQGAPSDHNFDTIVEAKSLKDHIDWTTGAGPDATNEIMPPGGPTPTLEERQNLSIWLACDDAT